MFHCLSEDFRICLYFSLQNYGRHCAHVCFHLMMDGLSLTSGGEQGAGGVREAGEEGAGSGIPKVAGSRRKREKLSNIAQYFAIKKNAKR